MADFGGTDLEAFRTEARDWIAGNFPAALKGRIEVTERRYRLGVANLKKAKKAGVPFLTGTDTGFAITPYGEWHAKELELFVDDLGFSPAAALRAATEVNARFMTQRTYSAERPRGKGRLLPGPVNIRQPGSRRTGFENRGGHRPPR